MTCMSFYPRSATVRAETDCTMLEMLRNVLDIMQRNKNFRAQLDQTYRAARSRFPPARRSRSSPSSRTISSTICANRVELLRFSPGQVICRQGDPADSFYLVRIGFVKVSENASRRRDGPRVSLAWRLFRRDRPARRRSAHGDLRGARSRRSGAHLRRRFCRMIEQFPEVRHGLETVAHERTQDEPRAARPWCAACRSSIFLHRD